MIFHHFTGTVENKGKTSHAKLTVFISAENSLHIQIGDNESGLRWGLSIFIEPFTTQMLRKRSHTKLVEDSISYQFSGNDIGAVSYQGSPEASFCYWCINKIDMKFRYFREGIDLTFCIDTDRGYSYYYDTRESITYDQEPLSFSINFFLPIEKLAEFLQFESAMVEQNEKNRLFVKQLKESQLPKYSQSRN
jgi:hypothetical protein